MAPSHSSEERPGTPPEHRDARGEREGHGNMAWSRDPPGRLMFRPWLYNLSSPHIPRDRTVRISKACSSRRADLGGETEG